MEPDGGKMITIKQYLRLMGENEKAGKIIVSALEAVVHAQLVARLEYGVYDTKVAKVRTDTSDMPPAGVK